MIDNKRLNNLRKAFKPRDIDAFLVSQADSRRYFSGFSGSAGYLLITHERQILATDFRYVEQVKREAPAYELYQAAGEMVKWFAEMAAGLGIRRLGYEVEYLSCGARERLEAAASPLGITLVPVTGVLENIRAVKDTEEIKLIKKAVAISDAAIARAGAVLREGISELELAWEIERYMREHGSQALPFEVIVAAGLNSALPHAQPSEYTVKDGDPVVIDIGARVGGYVSDLTRTLCAGQPDDRFQRVYSTVLTAQLAAEARIAEGITGHEADAYARAVIDEAGYGAHFGHGLGHGLGLVAHESPRLGTNSKDVLLRNMVFTVEPGIYLPEWGGVRIEDTVLLTGSNVEVLSKAVK
jgi:Xaa-Pro aminopeptidase